MAISGFPPEKLESIIVLAGSVSAQRCAQFARSAQFTRGAQFMARTVWGGWGGKLPLEILITKHLYMPFGGF